MPKFTIEATRVTRYFDTIEADSLEHAVEIVDGWIMDDFTQVNNAVTIDYDEVSE